MNEVIRDSLSDVKKLITSFDDWKIEGDFLYGYAPLTEENYIFYFSYYEKKLIRTIFGVKDRQDLEQEFLPISHINKKLLEQDFHMEIVVELMDLKLRGLNVYKDLNQAINSAPLAPECFMIINLYGDNRPPVICPEEDCKNEVLHYIQIGEIWRLIESFSDDMHGNVCSFYGGRKISIKLLYHYSDLSKDFDGYSRFKKTLTEENHSDEKKKILANTIYSLSKNEDLEKRFSYILGKFSSFSEKFEENYHAFAVSFSFDKIRKEYEEKFRDYVLKINSILSDSLTRSLAIPASTVLTFSALKNDSTTRVNDILVNSSVLLVAVFVFFVTLCMVLFQLNIISITRDEFTSLFTRFKTELKELELKDIKLKQDDLDKQCNILSYLLKFILSLALINLVITSLLFVNSFL
jgi:hypothetical protein